MFRKYLLPTSGKLGIHNILYSSIKATLVYGVIYSAIVNVANEP